MYKCTDPNSFQTLRSSDPVKGATVFLDPNTLSSDGTASLDSYEWSEDGNFMAYTVKKSGSDWTTIHIRDA
jgi:protease II